MMRTLPQLKADCVAVRNLCEYCPRQEYVRAYEFVQRKIEAAEMELFCDVKEK